MNEPTRPRQPRLLDPAYLRWLRKQPCCCGCGKPSPSDAAHIRASNIAMGKPYTGKSEKPSDFWAVPLNRSCHTRQHAHGDELGWWSMHGKNPFALAISHYREFHAQEGVTEPKAKGPRKVKPRKPRAQRTKIKGRGFDKRRRPFPGKTWNGG